MAWAILIAAGIFEVIWAVALKVLRRIYKTVAFRDFYYCSLVKFCVSIFGVKTHSHGQCLRRLDRHRRCGHRDHWYGVV